MPGRNRRREDTVKNYNPIRFLRDFLCGVLIGGGAILPGVSGGVLAVVFGIYRPFMEILTSPRKALPKYWHMLPALGLGGAVGFMGFAKCIAWMMTHSAAVTVWMFIGLIAGTLPSLFREAGKDGRTGGCWVSFGVCFAVMLGTFWALDYGVSVQVEPNLWWYTFCGVLWGMSVIIPGLTSSAILMALGLYEPLLNALATLNIPVLMMTVPGIVGSVLLFARLVNWFFKHNYAVALHGILGIVAASTLVIIPVSYTGAAEIAGSVVCCVGGYLLARLMDRLDRRISRDTP